MVLGIELSERAHARVRMLGYFACHLRGTHLQATAQRAKRAVRVLILVGGSRGGLPPRARCPLAYRRARRGLLGDFDSVSFRSDNCQGITDPKSVKAYATDQCLLLFATLNMSEQKGVVTSQRSGS